MLNRNTAFQLHDQQHGGQFRGRQSGSRRQPINTCWVMSERLPQDLVVTLERLPAAS